jgi:capsule polysaccharide modification protein KpsS
LSDNNIPNEKRKFAKDFIKDFIVRKQLPSYVDYQNSYSKKLSFKNYFKKELEMAKYWLKYLLKRKYFKKFDYESEIQFKGWLYYPIKALKWRFKSAAPKFLFDSLDESDRFFLFPLHVQPELSTSALATYFYNQLNTITNIAFSLPFPYKLYVKEHPLAFEGREKGFYQKLKQIPNVVLISPKENNEFLIKKSKGVITLTSTLGLEAVLAGKPAYALGDVFYDYHPLCRRVDSFEELRQRIERDLNEKSELDNLEDINVRFVLSYLKSTIPGDFFDAPTESSINNYKLIYQDIKKIFLNEKI